MVENDTMNRAICQIKTCHEVVLRTINLKYRVRNNAAKQRLTIK